MQARADQKLLELLKTDARFVDQDGELLRSEVLAQAWKMDPGLIKLLMRQADIKQKFFLPVEGCLVFHSNAFREYISTQHCFAGSYTRFRNKIGLHIDGKFLRERGEVSLVWPYKDCVLEGGQSKPQEQRKEIFFNEILAQHEINQLFQPKVLTNWQRHTAHGARPVAEIKRDENGALRENLIIKGNNLLALHCLKKRFCGAVKLIYIDPPYNTGSDSFGYNDRFKHSSWLTFMHNRLAAARELLRDDGVIFVQCDDNEQAYLKVLMDEVFGRANFINVISIRTGDSMRAISGGETGRLVKKAEFILLYQKAAARLNKIYESTLLSKEISDRQQVGKSIGYDEVLISYGDKAHYKTIEDGRGKAIKIYKHQNYKIVSVHEYAKQHGISKTEVYLSIPEKLTRMAASRSTIFKKIIPNINKEFYSIEYIPLSGKSKGQVTQRFFHKQREVIFLKNTVRKIDGKYYKRTALSNMWTDLSWHSVFNEGGVTLPGGKKPEALLKRIIELATQPGDIVLDYHLGSGTTAAVAHKMQRQYIGIEQLDYIESMVCARLKKVIQGEASGISKAVDWRGGGDFIYCQLMKYNETYMDKIQDAKTSEALLKLWQEIAENAFLNWYVNPEMPQHATDDFMQVGKANGLRAQKTLLAELLNKNQVYVNLSAIDDADFAVSREDKDLTRRFYGGDA